MELLDTPHGYEFYVNIYVQFNFYLSNTSILYIVFWHAKAPDLLVAAYMEASFVGGWEYVKTEWTQKLRLLSLLAIGQTCMP